MAKGHSTSKIRRRRTAPAKKLRETAATVRREPCKHAAKRSVDDDVINGERMRLLAAEAILSCLSFSITYSDWQESPGTKYALILGHVSDLMNKSLDTLDPVNTFMREKAAATTAREGGTARGKRARLTDS